MNPNSDRISSVLQFILAVGVIASLLAGVRTCIRSDVAACHAVQGEYFKGRCILPDGTIQ